MEVFTFTIAMLLSIIIAYFIGSINFALVISKNIYHQDIRDFGSKNAGMTNILRTYGKWPALLTFIGDFLKGVLTIALGRLIFIFLCGFSPSAFICGIIGIAALLGHIFPIYYHFKGGKGIMVSSGIILMINPWVLLSLLLIFLIFFGCTKIISLGSVMTAVFFPISTFIITWLSNNTAAAILLNCAVSLVISILVLYMHRGNIQRLLHGTEPKIGQNKK